MPGCGFCNGDEGKNLVAWNSTIGDAAPPAERGSNGWLDETIVILLEEKRREGGGAFIYAI
jgi:hypothetical protein